MDIVIVELWASSSPLPWCSSRSQMHFQSKNKWHRKTNEAIHSRPERRRLVRRRRRRIISGAAKLPCTTSIADHDAPPKGTTSNHQVWYSPGLLGMSAGCGMWQPWLGYCRPTGLRTAQRPQCCRPLRRHRGRTCYRPATCHHIHWPFINHTRYTTSSPSLVW